MRFPILRVFVRNYLHQDWDVMFADIHEALQSFLSDRSTNTGLRLKDEIDDMLSECGDDADIGALLHDAFGMDYLPEEDGLSYRAWLEGLAKTLESKR